MEPRSGAATLLALFAGCVSPGPSAERTRKERLVYGFESQEDLKDISKNAEGMALGIAAGDGVTQGRRCLKLTAERGAPWAALVLGGEAIRNWHEAEALLVDVYTEEEAPIPLCFELWDDRSRNLGTRCTFYEPGIRNGKRTLKWDLAHCRRNRKEDATWESLPREEKIAMDRLTKVKFFLAPSKDRDIVFFFDNLRLKLKSPEKLKAEAKAAEERETRLVIHAMDFEEGRGLGGEGVKFFGNWLPMHAKASIDSPVGEGNPSEKALTVRPAGPDPGWIAMELPLHRTEVEPEGWDGAVSVRLYNGGFESFYLQYLPMWPSDITFHRARFKAPEGRWTEIDMPLDRFLYCGRRPRRGCPLEYVCIVAEGPRDADSLFQIDDFELYRTRRAGLPPRKPRPKLPPGVLYRQDFDDPHDFDVEGFYPGNKSSNAFRMPGGLDAEGRPVSGSDPDGPGCLKIASYRRNSELKGGRRGPKFDRSAVVEFDVLLKGVRGFSLGARGGSSRFSLAVQPAPRPGKWTHCEVKASGFGQAGGVAFWEFSFRGISDGSGESCILIDNLVIRSAPVSPDARGVEGKDRE